MQTENSKLLENDDECLAVENHPDEMQKENVKIKRSGRPKSKYQKEDYRKIFKEQNVNRKGIQLLPNKVESYMGCADYLVSKKIGNEIPKKFTFLENLSERNILTSHSLAQRKLYHVEDDLQRLRKEEIERRQSLDEKWKDLQQKEINLRNSFIEFNKFMIENEEKRGRATEKITTMGTLAKERTQQIETLEKEYMQCKELKELLDNGIKNHAHIEKYLLSVVDKNHKKFSTIEDLFKRFDALLEARHILSNLFERHLTQLEDAKDAVDKMVMVKCVKIAGLNNILDDLHKRFETAQLACANWEQQHHEVVLEAMKKVMEIQSVKDSIWQIYQDICRRKNITPVYRGNYAKQLDIIKKALLKFRLVNKMTRAMEDKDYSPPSDGASSSDSIVVNVVQKMSKKLGARSKTFQHENFRLKTHESKVNLMKIPQKLMSALPLRHKTPLIDFKKENGVLRSRRSSLITLK